MVADLLTRPSETGEVKARKAPNETQPDVEELAAHIPCSAP